MKVILVNGSPNKNGCTYTALTYVEETLNEAGIDTEIFWIGTKPIIGCTACFKCGEKESVHLTMMWLMNLSKKHMMLTDSYSAHRFIMQVLRGP